MFRETLAQIKNLASILADPIRAERVMHLRLVSCLKVCKRVITRDLLSVLHKYKVGTNDVNKCIQVLNKNRDNINPKRKETVMLS